MSTVTRISRISYYSSHRRRADPPPVLPGPFGWSPRLPSNTPWGAHSPRLRNFSFFSLLSSLSSLLFSALFIHLDLIFEPLRPQKPSMFIKRVSKFKLFAIFASDTAWGHENQPKMLQMTPPSTPQGPPEEPRSAQERPGRAPRASQNHPWGALRGPLGVQKASWDDFGSLGPSFLSPQGLFPLSIPTFPEPLFSLLFLCSLRFSPFYQTLSDTAQRATVNKIDNLFNPPTFRLGVSDSVSGGGLPPPTPSALNLMSGLEMLKTSLPVEEKAVPAA